MTAYYRSNRPAGKEVGGESTEGRIESVEGSGRKRNFVPDPVKGFHAYGKSKCFTDVAKRE